MVVPYKTEDNSKKKQLEYMFNTIASRYDFLNGFLTLGIDTLWRKKVRKIVAKNKHNKILDMATGTGDLAIAMSKLQTKYIKGIDISENMLKIAKEKVVKKGLSDLICFEKGDAESIDEGDNSFDVVTCAFGVRNFENIQKGISEIYRVLDKGGRFIILELSTPRKVLIRRGYKCYFNNLLPFWGRLISKDKVAYKYLPESVGEFPHRDKFVQMLEYEGFLSVEAFPLTFGIATIYISTK